MWLQCKNEVKWSGKTQEGQVYNSSITCSLAPPLPSPLCSPSGINLNMCTDSRSQHETVDISTEFVKSRLIILSSNNYDRYFSRKSYLTLQRNIWSTTLPLMWLAPHSCHTFHHPNHPGLAHDPMYIPTPVPDCPSWMWKMYKLYFHNFLQRQRQIKWKHSDSLGGSMVKLESEGFIICWYVPVLGSHSESSTSM